MINDSAFWVISWEMKEIGTVARRLGKNVAPSFILPFVDRQSAFFGSHFDLLLNARWFDRSLNLATAYFHGRPGEGNQEFDTCFNNLKKYHERIHRIQVSHSVMKDIVLSSGIDPAKVFQIPIAINESYFSRQTEDARRLARQHYDIPEEAVVIGSFQKDGVGWGDGMEPKYPKGPDIFLKVVSGLWSSCKNLYILLSGPARGYVKSGLEELGIPFRHVFLDDYRRIGELYHCLDLYLVTSRDEGGPKSILESMASGVPLVTTQVGQAIDIVKHGINGWMVDVGDVDGLVSCVKQVIDHPGQREKAIESGLLTAGQNTYNSQVPLWERYFEGFVK